MRSVWGLWRAMGHRCPPPPNVPGPPWPVWSWLQLVPPVSCSHLDRLHDKGGFPQLSRQDAPGKVGKAASAGAHQPRGEQMEDAAPAMSLSASPAPLTKRPLPLACTLSAEPQEDQSDLPRIPLGTVAKSSPPGNSGLASPISGLVHTSCPILFLSQWWEVIQALLFPTSSQPECQQERLSHHLLED